MKISIYFVLLTLSLGSIGAETRQLIVSGNSTHKLFAETLKKLEQNKAALDERDVEVKTRRASSFSIVLIGKDGTEKWRTDKAFEIKKITQLIDQMPMRKLEMKQN